MQVIKESTRFMIIKKQGSFRLIDKSTNVMIMMTANEQIITDAFKFRQAQQSKL